MTVPIHRKAYIPPTRTYYGWIMGDKIEKLKQKLGLTNGRGGWAGF